ncbi:hypothetical protein SSX86_006109 [Deinandra increscens subsp. villosa]|uniref:Pectin acetylesterase n=1 Tax=Deinandra increscens subsp. villosa TaxID=3103831 RepID=A0AAP0DMF8_9ASTR
MADGLGSSMLMPELNFSGILSNKQHQNPKFYNWNRVYMRYCDGSSFTGDVEEVDQVYANGLYFRGARVFNAIVEELMSIGMKDAQNALLSGCSAGGLAAILNCDKFRGYFSSSTRVKCVPDAGYFGHVKDLSGEYQFEQYYDKVVTLHGSAKNLPSGCTSNMKPGLCFYPQYAMPYVKTPVFVVNSAYDVWQVFNILASNETDPNGEFNNCKMDLDECSATQLKRLEDFRMEFLGAVSAVANSSTNGMFINTCYTHCETDHPIWFENPTSKLDDKTMAEAVNDWFYDKAKFQKIDTENVDPHYCYDNKYINANYIIFEHKSFRVFVTNKKRMFKSRARREYQYLVVCVMVFLHIESSEEVGINIIGSAVVKGAEFYNWNRVYMRYCDGSSFTGDVEEVDQVYANGLYFRGARVFNAIVEELMSIGMKDAQNALLSGCSAGGLAAILNCDKFRGYFSSSTRVKCVPDAGYFGHVKDLSGEYQFEQYYDKVVTLHGSAKNLPSGCTSNMKPGLCFYPQYAMPYVKTPVFVVNSAYDVWQVFNILASNETDPNGEFNNCKMDLDECSATQLKRLEDFRMEFLGAVSAVANSSTNGMFINTCYTHCETDHPIWFENPTSKLDDKTMAEAVNDWFYDKAKFQKIDTENVDPHYCYDNKFSI